MRHHFILFYKSKLNATQKTLNCPTSPNSPTGPNQPKFQIMFEKRAHCKSLLESLWLLIIRCEGRNFFCDKRCPRTNYFLFDHKSYPYNAVLKIGQKIHSRKHRRQNVKNLGGNKRVLSGCNLSPLLCKCIFNLAV